MNSCNFIGFVSQEPTIRREADKADPEKINVIAYFTLGIKRANPKTTHKYDYIDCKAIGAIAETIEKKVVKNMKIGIEAKVDVLISKRGKFWQKSVYFRVTNLDFCDGSKEDVVYELPDDGTIEPEESEVNFDTL